jgi:hypothetical protein
MKSKTNKPQCSITIGDTSIPIKKKDLKKKIKPKKKALLKRIRTLESLIAGRSNTDVILSSLQSQLTMVEAALEKRMSDLELTINQNQAVRDLQSMDNTSNTTVSQNKTDEVKNAPPTSALLHVG